MDDSQEYISSQRQQLLFKPKSVKRQKISYEEKEIDGKLITFLEDGNVRLQNPEKIDQPLVIPLVSSERIVQDDEKISLNLMAEREILDDILGVGREGNNEFVRKINLVSSNKPLLSRMGRSENDKDLNDEDRFQRDLTAVAKDVDFTSEVYEQVPVEAFGAALLRGMGWTEDKKTDLSTNAKASSSSLPSSSSSVVMRPHRLGLGAMSKDSIQHHQKSRSAVVPLGDGSIVWIPSLSTRAQVVQWMGVPGLDQVSVRLEGDTIVRQLPKKEVRVISEREMLPYQQKEVVVEQKEVVEVVEQKEVVSTPKCGLGRGWLLPCIRVWVRLSIGLRPGTVLDVIQVGEAAVRLDGGRLLARVREGGLLPMLPVVGGACVVLEGTYRGQAGVLMGEGGWIQLSDDLRMLQCDPRTLAATSTSS